MRKRFVTRKLSVAILLASALCVMGAGPAAQATAPHYTDGTQCDGGSFCALPSNPPPLSPAFSTPCGIAIVDPSSFVFVTLHFVYGTTPPPAGVVPVTDDASDVVNYVGNAPGTFLVDVSSFVAGRVGFMAYTWNIGKGVTAWVPFDCSPFTVGYWGNHLAPKNTSGCTGLPSGTHCSRNGPWTNQFLPQNVGNFPVSTFQIAADVIAANNCSNASSSSQNAIGCLAAQLLAAELNVANMPNPCIVTVTDGINDANAFLQGLVVDGVTGIVYTGPTGTYPLSSAQRNEALVLKDKLANYNQGGGC
jgi:hypothetical protein